MQRFWDLVVDVDTVVGRLVTTGVLMGMAWLVTVVVGRLLAGRRDDPFDRYVTRKLGRYAVAVVLLVALAAVWRPFAGRLGLVVGIPYDDDWHQAEQVLAGAVGEGSARADARRAIEQMRRSYPIPPTDLEPRVFVRATDNWIELAARFVVPVRTARSAKDEISRQVLEALHAAGITIASATSTVNVKQTGPVRDI